LYLSLKNSKFSFFDSILDILDSTNDLYSPYSPATDYVRAAFARYAANATIHFKGKNIVSFTITKYKFYKIN
jgi:hypothetical protein